MMSRLRRSSVFDEGNGQLYLILTETYRMFHIVVLVSLVMFLWKTGEEMKKLWRKIIAIGQEWKDSHQVESEVGLEEGKLRRKKKKGRTCVPQPDFQRGKSVFSKKNYITGYGSTSVKDKAPRPTLHERDRLSPPPITRGQEDNAVYIEMDQY